MTPYHLIQELKNYITGFDVDLRDREDNKAKVLHDIKEAKKAIDALHECIFEAEQKERYSQQIFCDELTIEFSVNADFSASYIRKYEAVCLSMKTLKTIIEGERELQNASDEYLHARVTITDTDPEES